MKRVPINHLVTGQNVLGLIEEGYEVFIKTDFIYKICGLIFEDHEHFKSNTPFKRNYYIDFFYNQTTAQFYREDSYNSRGEKGVLLEFPTESLVCFVIQSKIYIG